MQGNLGIRLMRASKVRRTGRRRRSRRRREAVILEIRKRPYEKGVGSIAFGVVA